MHAMQSPKNKLAVPSVSKVSPEWISSMQLQMMQMENKAKRRGHSGSRTKDTARKIEKMNRNEMARVSNSVDSIAEKEQEEFNKTVKELK